MPARTPNGTDPTTVTGSDWDSGEAITVPDGTLGVIFEIKIVATTDVNPVISIGTTDSNLQVYSHSANNSSPTVRTVYTAISSHIGLRAWVDDTTNCTITIMPYVTFK